MGQIEILSIFLKTILCNYMPKIIICIWTVCFVYKEILITLIMYKFDVVGYAQHS